MGFDLQGCWLAHHAVKDNVAAANPVRADAIGATTPSTAQEMEVAMADPTMAAAGDRATCGVTSSTAASGPCRPTLFKHSLYTMPPRCVASSAQRSRWTFSGLQTQPMSFSHCVLFRASRPALCFTVLARSASSSSPSPSTCRTVCVHVVVDLSGVSPFAHSGFELCSVCCALSSASSSNSSSSSSSSSSASCLVVVRVVPRRRRRPRPRPQGRRLRLRSVTDDETVVHPILPLRQPIA